VVTPELPPADPVRNLQAPTICAYAYPVPFIPAKDGTRGGAARRVARIPLSAQRAVVVGCTCPRRPAASSGLMDPEGDASGRKVRTADPQARTGPFVCALEEDR